MKIRYQSLKSHNSSSLPGSYVSENIVVGVMRENFPEEGVEVARATTPIFGHFVVDANCARLRIIEKYDGEALQLTKRRPICLVNHFKSLHQLARHNDLRLLPRICI